MKNIIKLLSFSIVLISYSVTTYANELKLGIITPPSHQWTKTAKAFADEVKEKTEGRVVINLFPSGQLGNEAQMIQQLQRGSLDMGFITAGEIANRRVDFSALFAPYLVDSVEQAKELLHGKTATRMLAELNTLGLVGLGYGMAGLRQIVMNNEVNSVDDITGLKIRTMPVAPERDFWQKVGAAPTPIPLPGLYDAFANGQVDGMQIDFEGTWNTRYLDHAKTVLHSSHMLLPMVGVFSARSWQKLTQEDKKIIEKALSGHLDSLISHYSELDQMYLDKIKASGANVKSVDKTFFGEAVDTWYVEWRKKTALLAELEKEAAALK